MEPQSDVSEAPPAPDALPAAPGARGSMIRPLRSYTRLPRARRAAAAEAARGLLRAWYLVRARPFSRYARRLGTAQAGEVVWDWQGDMAPLRDVQWAVTRINRLCAGRFTCLMQAMAGQEMLRRRGVESAVVLGVIPGRSGPAPTAHAWLRVGPYIVLGQEERPGHVAVATYR